MRLSSWAASGGCVEGTSVARILVIDDEAAVREVIQMMLEESGHTVEIAADGNEGLQCYKDSPHELVLTDLHMPGMDGLETLKALRLETDDVKIIAMSGADTYMVERNLDSSRIQGADGTLQKPFELHELLEVVDRILQPC